jgi:hypothetical protein
MGENGGTKLQKVLLAENSAAYATDATSDASYAVEAEEYADVVIEDGECYFNYFDDIKDSARKLLSTGLKWGFGHFPIGRNKFRNDILSTHVTEKNICHALMNGPEVNESNHNKKRNWLKGHSVNEDKAWAMGVVADRIQVKKVCDDAYDYGNSPLYAGIDDCQDVLKEIDGNGLAVVMYSVNMESAAARKFIDKPSSAPLYTDYDGGKPKNCGSGKEDGRKYEDSYHEIPVIGAISIDFILRVFTGKRWSAWHNMTSCNGYQADDLKFNFGSRVFVPVTVDEGDGPEERTVVIMTVAATSNMAADVFIPKNTPYHRTIGAETAKKVLMDAKGWGWDIY